MNKFVISAVAASLTAVSFSQVLVDTNFSANTLGQLSGQASSAGANPWDGGTAATVTSVSGNNVVDISLPTLAVGASSSQVWVDLYTTPATGVTIPAGRKLLGSVDVFLDPANSTTAAGLVLWANGGANIMGFLGLAPNGSVVYRNGTGTVAGTIVTNAGPTSGWNNIKILTEQVNATDLRSTYYVNGVEIPGISHIRTIAGSNLASDFDLALWNVGTADGPVAGRFDNYRVELIPEPASMIALGFGALALLRRKNRK